MKNQKSQSGITLIALVVTIVVLLILAGVTIVYVLSDNSIFNAAQDAVTKTDRSLILEYASNAQSALFQDTYIPEREQKENGAAYITAAFPEASGCTVSGKESVTIEDGVLSGTFTVKKNGYVWTVTYNAGVPTANETPVKATN